MEFHPLRTPGFLHVGDDALGSRTGRVHEEGDGLSPGDQLGKQFEPFRIQLSGEEAHASDVGARSAKARDQALPDWVADTAEDDRDRRSRTLRSERRVGAACRCDHVDLAVDEIGG